MHLSIVEWLLHAHSDTKKYVNGPVQEIYVRIPSASSEGLGKSLHISRAFTAHIHEVWLNMKALNMKDFNLKFRPLSLLHFHQHGLLLDAYEISPKSRALVYEIYLFSFMLCN